MPRTGCSLEAGLGQNWDPPLLPVRYFSTEGWVRPEGQMGRPNLAFPSLYLPRQGQEALSLPKHLTQSQSAPEVKRIPLSAPGEWEGQAGTGSRYLEMQLNLSVPALPLYLRRQGPSLLEISRPPT